MDHQTAINNKIFTPETIIQKLAYWRFKEKKISFTNGCFDILHIGHADYLSKAASVGDILIVGLNSDNSVKRIKGETRPINPEDARAFLLASFQFIDAVILFNEDTPYELIKIVQPDFLIKGNDYAPEQIVGYDIVKEKGGEVITIPLVEGFSTSSILKNLMDK